MSRKTPTSNFTNEEMNPCFDESKLTQKCLERELYDYSKCEAYFQNYRTCKKFWAHVEFQRARAGISPIKPTKAEREKILKLKHDGVRVFSVND